MKTNELIDSLSTELAPVSRNAFVARLALGIGAGAGVSALAMLFWLGVRPDLMHAMTTPSYWMKFWYTALLAFFALWATVRLARPGSKADWAFVGAVCVFLVLTARAGFVLMEAPSADRMPLIMGHSAKVCPWLIAVLSVPILAGAIWSVRGLAPTRLLAAGAAAGLASGALGAWIYAFHCDESTAPFIFVFYTFGIGLLAAAGAIIARPLLRW